MLRDYRDQSFVDRPAHASMKVRTFVRIAGCYVANAVVRRSSHTGDGPIVAETHCRSDIACRVMHSTFVGKSTGNGRRGKAGTRVASLRSVTSCNTPPSHFG